MSGGDFAMFTTLVLLSSGLPFLVWRVVFYGLSVDGEGMVLATIEEVMVVVMMMSMRTRSSSAGRKRLLYRGHDGVDESEQCIIRKFWFLVLQEKCSSGSSTFVNSCR